MTKALYLTIDGVLSHLGFSQVLRVIEGLSGRGIEYTLVSLERPEDLANRQRVAMVEERCQQAQIAWYRSAYAQSQSSISVASNMARLGQLALGASRRHRPQLVHARAYHSAFLASAQLTQPWIFDARGYWIDERIEERRWFTNPWAVSAARSVETSLLRSADAVVTLTTLHAASVRSLQGRRSTAPLAVIPTCADYDSFRPATSERLPAPFEELSGRRLLGVVGSMNRAYRAAEAVQLCRKVISRCPDAHVLVLSAQQAEWTNALANGGVPRERFTVGRVDHEHMPRVMPLLAWGLLLLEPATRAKTAMMPTKLAEFFASGVRVCLHGCNSEVEQWVDSVGTGHVLPDLTEESLEAAAGHIASHLDDGPDLTAREITRGHFSLTSGIERYQTLIHQVTS